jgi:hypothetical protein
MKMLTIIATLLLTAGIANSASAATAPVRPTTVGGGVKNPWSMPYTLAIATAVPEPTTLTLLGVGAGAMLIRRRRK